MRVTTIKVDQHVEIPLFSIDKCHINVELILNSC